MATVYFTTASESYLPMAFMWADSVRRHEPAATIVLFFLEREEHESLKGSDWFDRVVSLGDLRTPALDRFIFRHTILECATALKPMLFVQAMSLFPQADIFVFMDPDIELFSPLDELRTEMSDDTIMVTPVHLVDIDAVNQIPLLRTGMFNLGFLALRRSQKATEFLSWWARKLEWFCYVDIARGLFVDQKWCDLALTLFPLAIIRHQGYNVAHWNIAQRPVTDSNGVLTVLEQPLRFIHFSNIALGRDLRYFRRAAPDETAPIHRLRSSYKRRMEELRQQHRCGDRWSLDYFDSGEQVAYETRTACRIQPQLLQGCDVPFSQSNEYFLSRSAGM